MQHMLFYPKRIIQTTLHPWFTKFTSLLIFTGLLFIFWIDNKLNIVNNNKFIIKHHFIFY